MIKIKRFKKFTILLLFLFSAVNTNLAQTENFPSPREEKLLNGLKLLVWNQPNNAGKVTVKLRIHSGAVFDQQGKEGTMALLGEILFPNDAIYEYFREDLNGNLEIESNYDFIQINATGDADKFLDILQTIATAISRPDITKETTAAVIAKQKEKIKNLQNDPKYLADRAVAERIYENFPYGRAKIGTEESLSKIDFADLIFAKQRFLTSDNATLAIVGNVKPDFAYRATRRYFGGWVKADEKIPASFRRPSEPETKFVILSSPIANSSELRFAVRNSARGDKDFYASAILAKILENRFKTQPSGNVSVVNQSNLLPSYLLIKFSDWNAKMIQQNGDQINLPGNTETMFAETIKKPVTDAEFQKAKQINFAENLDEYADRWLDLNTYKLISIEDELKKYKNLTLKDVQNVADDWKKQPVAKVLLLNTSESQDIPEPPKRIDNE